MTVTAPERARVRSSATIWLVAEREMTARLRSKSFLLSTAFLLLAILASIVIGGFAAKGAFGGNSDPVAVAVTEGLDLPLDPAAFDRTVAADADAAREMVRDGRVAAAIVPGAASQLTIVADSEAPESLISALTIYPEVELLTPAGQSGLIRQFVAFGFGIIFLMSAITFGTAISQSVVEEKQTRVVEILMSAISVRALLAGKILGNSLLAFAQVAAIAAIAVIGLTVTGQDALLAGVGSPIIWFVVFFILGFVLLAAMFSAFASLVSRQEDLGSALAPVTMLVMLPYFAVAFFNQNETVMTVMSYVPFSAPVGMPVRLFFGEALWWEPLVSLLILIAATVLVILLAARIYSNSLLHTGGKLKLSTAMRG